MNTEQEGQGGTKEALSFAELADLRRKAYFFLASLFHQPSDDHLKELAGAAAELKRESGAIESFPFSRRLRELIGDLERLSEEEETRLQEEYVGIFQVGVSGNPCPLYESAYLDRSGQQTGWIVAQVERAYTDAGLTLSSSAKGELPDHAGLELEFMSLLCAAEAEAWRNDLVDEAADALTIQKTFLDRHLGRWFPRLARRLCSVAAQTSIYRKVADATLAFVVHDEDLVGALTESNLLCEDEDLAAGM